MPNYMPVTNMDELNEAFKRCRAAQAKFATYTQEQVDKIFLAAATAANKARIRLAKMAVEETGMGYRCRIRRFRDIYYDLSERKIHLFHHITKHPSVHPNRGVKFPMLCIYSLDILMVKLPPIAQKSLKRLTPRRSMIRVSFSKSKSASCAYPPSSIRNVFPSVS